MKKIIFVLFAINGLNMLDPQLLSAQSFTPAPIRFCPRHTGGDREFGGHGPSVTARVNLEIMPGNTQLAIRVNFTARETQSDWTNAQLVNERRVIWTAPADRQIVRILSNTFSETSYTDSNHDLDLPPVRGGTLIRQFRIKGDTGGTDVGNCTEDDVFLELVFNEIRLETRPSATTARVTPATFRLYPRHIAGDREFGGNGPAITASASAIVLPGNVQAALEIHFSARETTADWTEGRIDAERRVIYTAPEGMEIVRISSALGSSATYTDTNHDLDVPPVRGGTLVRQFRIKGDTGGLDLGNTTEDDTYIEMDFNEVVIEIRPLPDGIRETTIPGLLITRTLGRSLSGITGRLNNYGPRRGDSWHLPGDCFVQLPPGLGGAREEFPVEETRFDPGRRYYLSDINLRSADGSLRNNMFSLNLNWESDGPEMRGECVSDATCALGTPTFQLDNLIMRIMLRPTVSAGRLTYSDVRARIDYNFSGDCGILSGLCTALVELQLPRIMANMEREIETRFNTTEVRSRLSTSLNEVVTPLIGTGTLVSVATLEDGIRVRWR